jgi:hypothetical protein
VGKNQLTIESQKKEYAIAARRFEKWYQFFTKQKPPPETVPPVFVSLDPSNRPYWLILTMLVLMGAISLFFAFAISTAELPNDSSGQQLDRR